MKELLAFILICAVAAGVGRLTHDDEPPTPVELLEREYNDSVPFCPGGSQTGCW